MRKKMIMKMRKRKKGGKSVEGREMKVMIQTTLVRGVLVAPRVAAVKMNLQLILIPCENSCT